MSFDEDGAERDTSTICMPTSFAQQNRPRQIQRLDNDLPFREPNINAAEISRVASVRSEESAPLVSRLPTWTDTYFTGAKKITSRIEVRPRFSNEFQNPAKQAEPFPHCNAPIVSRNKTAQRKYNA